VPVTCNVTVRGDGTSVDPPNITMTFSLLSGSQQLKKNQVCIYIKPTQGSAGGSSGTKCLCIVNTEGKREAGRDAAWWYLRLNLTQRAVLF